MKKKVLAIAVFLMAAVMLTTPVFAAPSANAWRIVPASLVTNQAVSYEELTEACLAWGLTENPYPAPPTTTEVLDLPYLYVTGGSAYYIFTQQIGDDVFVLEFITDANCYSTHEIADEENSPSFIGSISIIGSIIADVITIAISIYLLNSVCVFGHDCILAS